MNAQQDFFPDPVIEYKRKERLILDIMNCKKVSRPLPSMTVIEMGPVQIQEAIEILDTYLDEDRVESMTINEIIEWEYAHRPAIACELDTETGQAGQRVRNMIEALDDVL